MRRFTLLLKILIAAGPLLGGCAPERSQDPTSRPQEPVKFRFGDGRQTVVRANPRNVAPETKAPQAPSAPPVAPTAAPSPTPPAPVAPPFDPPLVVITQPPVVATPLPQQAQPPAPEPQPEPQSEPRRLAKPEPRTHFQLPKVEEPTAPKTGQPAPRPVSIPKPAVIPKLGASDVAVIGFWDRVPRGRHWTAFMVKVIDRYGEALLDTVPTDINEFCPTYSGLGRDARLAFWVGMVSAMAEKESSFDPSVEHAEKFRNRKGELVVSRGLLQISLESIQPYQCGITTDEQIHDPELNLTCAVRMLNHLVPRDRIISRKVLGGFRKPKWLGASSYWAVLRTHDTLEFIKSRTRSLAVCL
jgi:hypothetical protein